MDLLQLEVFLAAIDEGSFAAAARRLNLGRSTVTERIAALERRVGAPLFLRAPMLVSEAGWVLEPYARRIVAQSALAQLAVADLANARDARLRVGLMAGGAAELNRPLHRAWRVALPRTKISIVELALADIETAVVQRRVDAAILRSPVGDPALRSVQLFTAGRVVTVACDGPLAGAETLQVSDLADVPFTGVSSHNSSAFREFFLLVGERNGERPERVLEACTLCEAAFNVSVHGAIAVPSAEALRVFPIPGVRAVPLVDAHPSGPVAVCRRDDRRDMVRTFMQVAAHIAATCLHLVPDAIVAHPAPST